MADLTCLKDTLPMCDLVQQGTEGRKKESQSACEEQNVKENDKSQWCENEESHPCENVESQPCENEESHPCENEESHPCENEESHPCENEESHPCENEETHQFENEESHPCENEETHPCENEESHPCKNNQSAEEENNSEPGNESGEENSSEQNLELELELSENEDNLLEFELKDNTAEPLKSHQLECGDNKKEQSVHTKDIDEKCAHKEIESNDIKDKLSMDETNEEKQWGSMDSKEEASTEAPIEDEKSTQAQSTRDTEENKYEQCEETERRETMSEEQSDVKENGTETEEQSKIKETETESKVKETETESDEQSKSQEGETKNESKVKESETETVGKAKESETESNKIKDEQYSEELHIKVENSDEQSKDRVLLQGVLELDVNNKETDAIVKQAIEKYQSNQPQQSSEADSKPIKYVRAHNKGKKEEVQRRRGLMSSALYSLFIRYLTTKQMPTDRELTEAGFEKCYDGRQQSFKMSWMDMPPNCKTAAKFRQWAAAFQFDERTVKLMKGGKIVVPIEHVPTIVMNIHRNNGAEHLSLKATISQYGQRFTLGKLAFGVTLQKLRRIVHKCPDAACQNKLYVPSQVKGQYCSISNNTSKSSSASPDSQHLAGREQGDEITYTPTTKDSLQTMTAGENSEHKTISPSSTQVKPENTYQAVVKSEVVDENGSGSDGESLTDLKLIGDALDTHSALAKSPTLTLFKDPGSGQRKRSRGKKCCVPNCPVYQYSPTGESTGTHFFQLPSKPWIAAAWEVAIGKVGLCKQPGARICQNHFKPGDLDTTFSGKLRRRHGVIPTIFPPPPPPAELQSKDVLSMPGDQSSYMFALKTVDEGGRIHFNLFQDPVTTTTTTPSSTALSQNPNKLITTIKTLDEASNPTIKKVKVNKTWYIKPPGQEQTISSVKTETESAGKIDGTGKAVAVVAPQTASGKDGRGKRGLSQGGLERGSGGLLLGPATSLPVSSFTTSSTNGSAAIRKRTSSSNSVHQNIPQLSAVPLTSISPEQRNPSLLSSPTIKTPRETTADDSTAQSKWIENAMNFEAMRAKRIEAEMQVLQRKLDLEKLKILMQEQKLKQLDAAKKHTVVKRELLMTLMLKQLKLKKEEEEERRDADTEANYNGNENGDNEKMMGSRDSGRDKVEIDLTENDMEIDLTTEDSLHSNSSSHDALPEDPPPAPCHVKGSPVLFRSSRGNNIRCSNVDEKLVRDVLKRHRERKQGKSPQRHRERKQGKSPQRKKKRKESACSDREDDMEEDEVEVKEEEEEDVKMKREEHVVPKVGDHDYNCIVSQYKDLLGIIQDIRQDIPKAKLCRQKTMDTLQTRLDSALSQVRKCKNTIHD